jgi:hypothetical protein
MRKKILDAMKKRMEALVLFLDQRHRYVVAFHPDLTWALASYLGSF